MTHSSSIIAGDLLRAEQARPGSEFGEMISRYIREGLIVPQEVTIKVSSSRSGIDDGTNHDLVQLLEAIGPEELVEVEIAVVTLRRARVGAEKDQLGRGLALPHRVGRDDDRVALQLDPDVRGELDKTRKEARTLTSQITKLAKTEEDL